MKKWSRLKLRITRRGTSMIAQAKSYELSGMIDKDHHLVINEKLPVNGPKKVKVIVLVEESTGHDEKEFMRAAQAGSSFDFWNDSEEDIYSLEDGTAVK